MDGALLYCIEIDIAIGIGIAIGVGNFGLRLFVAPALAGVDQAAR
jgi:hypothetical protein